MQDLKSLYFSECLSDSYGIGWQEQWDFFDIQSDMDAWFMFNAMSV